MQKEQLSLLFLRCHSYLYYHTPAVAGVWYLFSRCLNIDEVSNAVGMDSPVGAPIPASLDPHKPPPAPARINDDDTGEEEAPHPHVAVIKIRLFFVHAICHCIALNQQSHMNPPPAPARTEDDDTGAKYGRTRSHARPQCSTIRHQYNKASNTVPHTRRSGCVAILGSFSLPKTPTRSMQRQDLQQNREHAATQTPTLKLQVPSLSKNPPDKDTDESPTQIWMHSRPSPSVQPLNTTIDFISYHTPAAAGVVIVVCSRSAKPHDKNRQDETRSHL
ncbi:hypothetical protein BS47DRAFT_1357631 [Hydnum rufescens UP504]|uniref:Uncharacterized protein n=1 Tax=Hydnum rufescens UP504 TaxID=1448309 RepID=A0A9P6B9A0_9AGAM|nr:hypothetical protein BS47DRAFT_1357631 [Hydnum rufescens UP504]